MTVQIVDKGEVYTINNAEHVSVVDGELKIRYTDEAGLFHEVTGEIPDEFTVYPEEEPRFSKRLRDARDNIVALAMNGAPEDELAAAIEESRKIIDEERSAKNEA